jgi:hypothetical protein
MSQIDTSPEVREKASVLLKVEAGIEVPPEFIAGVTLPESHVVSGAKMVIHFRDGRITEATGGLVYLFFKHAQKTDDATWTLSIRFVPAASA